MWDNDYLGEDLPFDLLFIAPIATFLVTHGVVAAAQYAPFTLPIIAVGAFVKNIVKTSNN